ncbi:hypothetical protein DOY81_003846, partial [Sarcophaga bullata]
MIIKKIKANVLKNFMGFMYCPTSLAIIWKYLNIITVISCHSLTENHSN